ncbi:DMT family transporter [Lichenifustis flavocetrariae]|uniref:DMT family transporter n=1 Tax=Lichenifustis flavocetrariae TaxID=2949735 RepID=A0AA42CL27_9HYPH|nr:DMT family transporter [Lichenifustis flavocetrariae]MCW6509931.1 DMT family transporter [Lichenifustis flavocetrariae]
MSEPVSTLRPLKGIGLSALGYGLFSVQDATVKWLVAGYAVPQILFTRSLVIVVIALLIGGRRNIAALAQSRNKGALALRSFLILVAWLSYYNAARSLGLAQLTTLYYAAPIIVVILSVVLLKEVVSPARWLAVAAGFGGVALAADPHGAIDLVPACLALFAACCWGLSIILVRLINRSDTTTNQMIVINTLFAAACAPMLLWYWKTPDPFSLALMLILGVAGGLGQFFLYEGFRFAPASALAPIEYTGLVWACLYGYVIWGDIPRVTVFAGAALIVGSSLTLVLFERRRAAAALRPPAEHGSI